MKKRIIFIYGNNKVLIEEEQARCESNILAGRDPSLCVRHLNMKDLIQSPPSEGDQMGQFFLDLQTPPFLTDCQIFILSHLETIKGNKNFISKLADILTSVAKSSDTWVILTAAINKEQELSATLLKVIKASGQIYKFVSYDDAMPDQWCMERAKALGLVLSKPSALLLISLAGNQLARLGSELEKLSLLLPQGATVTQEDLLKNIHGGTEFSIFRITQSLSERKLLPALETLDQILGQAPKEHALLFTLIVRQFRKLTQIACALQCHTPESEILKSLSLHPFLGKRMIAQARLFSHIELLSIINQLAKMDIPLKFHATHAKQRLQHLFESICKHEPRV